LPLPVAPPPGPHIVLRHIVNIEIKMWLMYNFFFIIFHKIFFSHWVFRFRCPYICSNFDCIPSYSHRIIILPSELMCKNPQCNCMLLFLHNPIFSTTTNCILFIQYQNLPHKQSQWVIPKTNHHSFFLTSHPKKNYWSLQLHLPCVCGTNIRIYNYAGTAVSDFFIFFTTSIFIIPGFWICRVQ
jgi:hypothetical protein